MKPHHTIKALTRLACLSALAAACSLLGACSSEMLYATGRNAQRAECMKRNDAGERERCLRDAGMSHDQYQREMGQ
jgi:hypothetical protein